MKTLEIKATEFDHEYYGTTVCGQRYNNEYVWHNIDVMNKVIINGVEHDAIYQSQSFWYNDFNCPSDMLELSEPGGTSEFLCRVAELHAEDLHYDVISQINEDCEKDYSVEEYIEIYKFLKDQEKAADNKQQSIIEDYELSNDAEDWEEVEGEQWYRQINEDDE